jgi:hypothetical protein
MASMPQQLRRRRFENAEMIEWIATQMQLKALLDFVMH